jgi:hypothetical protein
MAWPSTSSPSVRGSSSPFPHHHELPRRRGPPRAPSSSGRDRIICLVVAQVPSRRSAARRRDKTSVAPPAVFYIPFPPILRTEGCVVRDPASRPHPAARPRRSASPWPQRPPSPTPPTSWGVPPSGTTSLLSGEHPVLPRRPTGRGKAPSASKAAPSARRPSKWGRTILVSAPQPRATTPVEHLSRDPGGNPSPGGKPRYPNSARLLLFPFLRRVRPSPPTDHRDMTIASDAPS